MSCMYIIIVIIIIIIIITDNRQQFEDKIHGEKWQGKYLTNRWNDDNLNVQGCFGWLKEWPSVPTHTIPGMMELYEQMLPTRVYTTYKTRTNPSDDTLCL